MTSVTQSFIHVVERLSKLENPDGGFPYHPGFRSAAEPTTLALLVAQVSPAQEPTPPAWPGKALTWLQRCLLDTGAASVSPDFPDQGMWVTPLVAILFHHLGRVPLRDRACAALLASRSRTFPNQPHVKQNNTLVGWAWNPQTFAWVEPTAWALLALRICGLGSHDRSREAVELLLDRQIATGGWNLGNPNVYGQDLLPFFDTTAIAVLALNGLVPPERLEPAVAFLAEGPGALVSLYNVALITLALRAVGHSTDRWRQALGERLQNLDERTINVAHLGFAGLALAEEEVFRP
jgi:hypothetical protein